MGGVRRPTTSGESVGAGLAPGWRAGLELHLDQRLGVTRLAGMRHWGPLRVQRPFYPGDAGECHLYLLHPPGGMVSGDTLDIDVRLDPGARALLTTPSAGKIYRGNGGDASQHQRVVCRLGGNSYLEWLPQETIVFAGARGELSLRVELDQDAQCCLWDMVCLGRPASGELFTAGFLRQRLAVYRGGLPLYMESNLFRGGSALLNAPWGLGGNPVSGALLATCSLSGDELADLRDSLVRHCREGEQIAVSDLGGVLVVRYLGPSAEYCRQHFVGAWQLLKPRLTDTPVIEPRIWRT